MKKPALALIFGGKGKEPPESEDEGMFEEMGEGSPEEGVPPDFESAAIEAFPELEKDPARIEALYRMVQCCKE